MYSRPWFEKFKNPVDFLGTGFGKELDYKALSLIWQRYMLDLLGKRDQAVFRYRQAKEMNIDKWWMHAQYGMEYRLSSYAGERLKTPFTRKENSNPD